MKTTPSRSSRSGRVNESSSSRPCIRPHPDRVSSKQPQTRSALIEFALKAAAALRKECAYLVQEQNPSPFCSIISVHLSNVEKRLQRKDSPSETRTLRLLVALEGLAKFPHRASGLTSVFLQTSYPTLIHAIDGEIDSVRSSIRRLAQDGTKREDRKRLEDLLKAFAGVNSKSGALKLSTLSKPPTQPNLVDETTQCLQRLYSALGRLCQCVAHGGGFKANISLDSMQPKESKVGITANTLIAHRPYGDETMAREWKETCITVGLASNNEKAPAASIALSQKNGKGLSSLCGMIQSKDLGCLQLTATSNGLIHQGNQRSQGKFVLQSASVPLESVLASSNLKRHMFRKALLCLLIARAVWRFYESDWMSENWSKKTVQFMRRRIESQEDGIALDLQPFLFTEFQAFDNTSQATVNEVVYGEDVKDNSRTSGLTHIFPNILALGIILLEIETEQNLEDIGLAQFLDESGKERANARHFAACEYIESAAWRFRSPFDTLPAMKQAIEICIKPDTGVISNDSAQIRKKLFEKVVNPLEILVKGLFGETWETLDPGHITFKPLEKDHDETPVSKTANVLNNGVEFKPSRSSSHRADKHSSWSFDPADSCHSEMDSDPPPQLTSVRLKQSNGKHDTQSSNFSKEEPSKSLRKTSNGSFLARDSVIIDSSSWLETFDKSNVYLRQFSTYGKSVPVKIAVLDTGCDSDDGFFSGLGSDHLDDLPDRWLDLVDNSTEPLDEDLEKHGTSMAALLFRLAPEALIYIIRIARNSSELIAAESTVAQAIKTATDTWDVDIISMSFGFDHQVKIMRNTIGDIGKAEAKDDRILFFAAANNSGLNQPEMFPAHLENVIAVRGTGIEGDFKPRYNPATMLADAGAQFGTLAVDVPCVWPETRLIKSGCSVATPILAAIAAAIIAFVRRNFSPDDRFQGLIQTRLGMSAVFRKMTARSGGDRSYVVLWQLFERERDPRTLIAAALMELPRDH